MSSTPLLRFWEGMLEQLPRHAVWLLGFFCCCLVVGNWGRLDEWGHEGFTLYLTQAIMQTTLFDFSWVLFVVTYFLHQDARRYGIRYWWVFPSYPFMPTIGLLAYFIVRERKRRMLDKTSTPAPAEDAR